MLHIQAYEMEISGRRERNFNADFDIRVRSLPGIYEKVYDPLR